MCPIFICRPQVWYPDVLVETLNEFVPDKLALVVVYSSGSLFISVNVMKTIACTMQLKNFLSMFKCKFTMGSWAYISDYDLKPRLSGTSHAAIDLGFSNNRTTFHFRESEQGGTFLYNCCPDPYPLIGTRCITSRTLVVHLQCCDSDDHCDDGWIPRVRPNFFSLVFIEHHTTTTTTTGFCSLNWWRRVGFNHIALDDHCDLLGYRCITSGSWYLDDDDKALHVVHVEYDGNAITIVNVSLFNFESRSGPEAAEKMVKYFDILKKSDGSVKPKVMLDWLVICGVKPSTVSKVKMMQRENSDLEKVSTSIHGLWLCIKSRKQATIRFWICMSLLPSVRKCLGMHEDSNLRRISKRHAEEVKASAKSVPQQRTTKEKRNWTRIARCLQSRDVPGRNWIFHDIKFVSHCITMWPMLLCLSPCSVFILVIVTYPMLQWIDPRMGMPLQLHTSMRTTVEISVFRNTDVRTY